ncbi:MAG: A/G-specific adenine glycosylase [Planctomycetaceae bacterium]|jgi:A/G-specific adenine glycosylase|nr:A/G-specific adenine glycosylase [Planctomycetaceae bacterium]
MDINYTIFRRRIFAWYAKHSRLLPWRNTGTTIDPYRVWVSEIMLQQTTTKTVEGYFDRFVKRFPTIAELAAAPIDEVNRLWEGLGYYRRCVQMHRAAQEIVTRFGGVFPNCRDDVLSLPGIGRYTAGAILSIAFDQRQPILEANTIRLHARLLALRADPTQNAANALLWNFAEEILPQKKTGRFNQALMDIGNLICTCQEPQCLHCPVVQFCETAKLGLQWEIPYQKNKEKKEDRTEVALLVRKQGKILLVRYPEGVRWAGLWDFPRAETNAEQLNHITSDPKLRERLALITGRRLEPEILIETIKHSVTRFRITLLFFKGIDHGKISPSENTENAKPYEFRWVTPSELQHIPLNSTGRKLVQNINQETIW